MSTVRDEIIGAGWTFPMRFNAAGGVGLSTRERKIEESIRLILSTAVGERPMRPEFGCKIHDYVFGVPDADTANEIAVAVKASLRRWEPRVQIMDVNVAPDPDDAALLWIDISYQAVDTNDPRNLVFPFYTIPAEETSAHDVADA
jgi:phage baseplate assembly protein W